MYISVGAATFAARSTVHEAPGGQTQVGSLVPSWRLSVSKASTVNSKFLQWTDPVISWHFAILGLDHQEGESSGL